MLKYKSILILAIINLIIAFFIPLKSNAVDNLNYYESSCSWETYNDNPDLFKQLKDLPSGTTSKNSKGRPFNYRVWLAKGVIVYGTCRDANPDDGVRVNYKAATLNPGGVCFYKKPGKDRGEYRYHGFTKEDNLYTNINFPNDNTKSGEALSEKRWVYKYWNSIYISNRFKGEQVFIESNYNRAARMWSNTIGQKTKQWINQGISAFKLQNGINDDGTENTSQEFYNYLNILSPPSAKYNGEGRMFHLDSSGKPWYQTFTVSKFAKEHTKVTVSVEIANQSKLKFDDFGSHNKQGFDNETLEVQVKVKAILCDDVYINDDVKKTLYYTRYDREFWNISLNGAQALKKDILFWDNKAECLFKIPMTKAQIKALTNGKKSFSASARCNYFQKNSSGQNEYDEGSNTNDATFTINPIPTIEETDEGKRIPVIVDPKCSVPEVGYDIVPFQAIDNTDMLKFKKREVYINGQLVDASNFFSGNYIFGIGNDGLKKIDIYYTSIDDVESFCTEWAFIYDTMPNAQFAINGTFKQNRELSITDTSPFGNVQIVVQNYPITSYQWKFRSVSGDQSSLKTRNISDIYKEIMYKMPGSYEIELIVTNSLGRVSEPYLITFEIFPDYAPAVEIDLNNSVIARNETLSSYNYNATSTDNDNTSSNVLQLWYDKDNNGTCETLINTFNGKDGFPEFHPDKLGKYKYTNTVVESFGQETLSEFITSEDIVSKTVEREFLVDNLVPMTGLYIDIPVVRPEVDAFILLDKNLHSNKVDYIQNNRVNFDNELRSNNILSNVEIWDMHTYIYSQPASTSINTGTLYPSSSTLYASGGYEGTLSLTSATDNGYYHDFGHYETKTETKTATGTKIGYNWLNYIYTPTGWKYQNMTATNQPTIEYSDAEGYTGTLDRDTVKLTDDTGVPTSTASIGDTHVRVKTCQGNYVGTVSRQVTIWVPDVRWVSNYTGFYSGTIYKSVRQPAFDPFKATSYKYVIYISDGNISELKDLQNVLSKSDAKLILIGSDDIKFQIPYAYFILNNRPIDEIITEALKYLLEKSPKSEEHFVLADTDTFTMNAADFDEETDPIVEQKMQYVQDENYYDNPTGTETNSPKTYSETTGWIDTFANQFKTTGKFTVYRRIKDQPSSDPAFANYSKYSGIPYITIFSHRKPIAKATLSWDFDNITGEYLTSWVDLSYDLDHNISREDKGIIERKIMYRKSGEEWNYRIPDRLVAGTYELKYYVKDLENTWSDPFTLNFTLQNIPPLQFEAKLKTKDPVFSLSNIPASEMLTVFDLWTRFPYNVHLQIGLYKGASLIAPVRTVSYSLSTGFKSGNDINWNDVDYEIPSTTPDGSYTLKVTAIGDFGQSSYKDFAVCVNTPINLSASINGSTKDAEINADEQNSFVFNTTQYVSRVELNFKGHKYSSYTGDIQLIKSTSNTKTWEIKLNVPIDTVTHGETGIASFRAYTPSEKNETANVNYNIIALQAYDFTIISILDINWRGFYFDLNNPVNGDGEKFGYYKKPNTDIKTTQLPVNSLSKISYTALGVKAGCKIKGYIRVKGNPDTVNLDCHYITQGQSKSIIIPTLKTSTNLYSFEWNIPIDCAQKSFVWVNLVLNKNSQTYGNERWIDTWPSANTNRQIFYISGQVTDDIILNQSH